MQSAVLQLIERLEVPELCYKERLDITTQLREALGVVPEHEQSQEQENVELAGCCYNFFQEKYLKILTPIRNHPP